MYLNKVDVSLEIDLDSNISIIVTHLLKTFDTAFFFSKLGHFFIVTTDQSLKSNKMTNCQLVLVKEKAGCVFFFFIIKLGFIQGIGEL